MDRLTYIDHKGWYAEQDGIRHRGIIVDRLAAYEDTGLEPEEIEVLAQRRHDCKIECLLDQYNKIVEDNASLRAELDKVTQERDKAANRAKYLSEINGQGFNW